jgi:hypothetical protein
VVSSDDLNRTHFLQHHTGTFGIVTAPQAVCCQGDVIPFRPIKHSFIQAASYLANFLFALQSNSIISRQSTAVDILPVDDGVTLQKLDQNLLNRQPHFLAIDPDVRCALNEREYEPLLTLMILGPLGNVVSLPDVDWPFRNIVEHIDTRL